MIEQGGRGGVTDYTEQLVRALAAQGVEVELATATDHVLPPLPGVRVHAVFPYLRATTAPRRLARRLKLHWAYNALGYLVGIARLLPAARRCRVAHFQGFHLPALTAFAMLAVRVTGARVVHTPHNTFERSRHDPGTGRRAMEALPTRVIVHSQADVDELPERVRVKATVIPHGEYRSVAQAGGAPDRSACRAELGLLDGDVAVLLFGQLRIEKGLEDLLLALRSLPSVRALVGGEDVGALAVCEPLLRELGERVVLREGFMAMTEAARLFAATDVVALPYRTASASGVLTLAYGFARPVVVYPVGGLPEAVLDGETGWICARADPEALVDALTDVVAVGEAERLRRGAAGDRFAAQRLGWPAIARRTAEVYAEALA